MADPLQKKRIRWIVIMLAVTAAGVVVYDRYTTPDYTEDVEDSGGARSQEDFEEAGPIPPPSTPSQRVAPLPYPEGEAAPPRTKRHDVAVLVIELTPTLLGGRDLQDRRSLDTYQRFLDDGRRSPLRLGLDRVAASLQKSRSNDAPLDLRVVGVAGRNSGSKNKTYAQTEWVLTGVTPMVRRTVPADQGWIGVRDALDEAAATVIEARNEGARYKTASRNVVIEAVRDALTSAPTGKPGRSEVHYVMDHRGIFDENNGSSKDLEAIWKRHLERHLDRLRIHYFENRQGGGRRWDQISPRKACLDLEEETQHPFDCVQLHPPTRALLVEAPEMVARLRYAQPGESRELSLGILHWEGRRKRDAARALVTDLASLRVYPDGHAEEVKDGVFEDYAVVKKTEHMRRNDTTLSWSVEVDAQHEYAIEVNGRNCASAAQPACEVRSGLSMEPEHVVRIEVGSMEPSPELSLSERWGQPFVPIRIVTTHGIWRDKNQLILELQAEDPPANAPITAILLSADETQQTLSADADAKIAFRRNGPLEKDIEQHWILETRWNPDLLQVELSPSLRARGITKGEGRLRVPFSARALLDTISLSTAKGTHRLTWSDDGPQPFVVARLLAPARPGGIPGAIALRATLDGASYGAWSPEACLSFGGEASLELHLQPGTAETEDISLSGQPVQGAAPSIYPSTLEIEPTSEDAVRAFFLGTEQICRHGHPCAFPFSVYQPSPPTPPIERLAEAENDTARKEDWRLGSISGIDADQIGFCLLPLDPEKIADTAKGDKDWVSARRLPDGDWVGARSLVDAPCPADWSAAGTYQIRVRKNLHSQMYEFGTHDAVLRPSLRSPSFREGQVTLKNIQIEVSIPRSPFLWLLEGLILFLALITGSAIMLIRRYSKKARMDRVIISGWVKDNADQVLSNWKDALQSVTDLKDIMLADDKTVTRMVAVLRATDVGLSRVHAILKEGFDKLHDGNYDDLPELVPANRKGQGSRLVQELANSLENNLAYVQLEYKQTLEYWMDAAEMMVEFQKAANRVMAEGEMAAQEDDEAQLRILSLSLKQFKRRTRGWLRRVEPTLRRLGRAIERLEAEPGDKVLVPTRLNRFKAKLKLHDLWRHLRALRALAPTYHLQKNIFMRLLRLITKKRM